MMSVQDRLQRRFEEARERMHRAEVIDVEEVLRRRSRDLAERELEPQAPDVFSDVVVVRRADLTLAVPVDHAREAGERLLDEVADLLGSVRMEPARNHAQACWLALSPQSPTRLAAVSCSTAPALSQEARAAGRLAR